MSSSRPQAVVGLGGGARAGAKRNEATDDLVDLVSISDEAVVACLRDRYLLDLLYTSLGPSSLVAINPHKFIHANSDQTLSNYAQDHRNTEQGRDFLPPHVFQLAGKAYFDMTRTGRDQSILMSGETGSGKSELRRLAMKALVDFSLSSPGKKGAKLGQQIPNAEFILESFGNARTIHNANASRFGKYTELQFTERGRLAGAKTLDYYLERSRVAGPSPGERNFHVFYYLVAGASQEERIHLRLTGDPSSYRLLGATPRGAAGGVTDDGVRFEQLKQAFKLVGLSKRLVAQICQLIAAILHIGNLEFVVDHDKNVDAAVVRNWDVLETIGEFLGVDPIDLEGVFNCKTTVISKEVCTVFLDPEGASANRDDLAKSLYGLLFAWLNENINERLCRDDFANFIGILDLPGFQNLSGFGARTNSLDQFCVNFANERLQNWILQATFEGQTAEFAAENLTSVVPSIPFFDNSECVRMLSTTPGGLIHIMDDQTKKMGKKTDHTMVEAFGKRWGNHSSFKAGGMDRAGFPTFTVNHYNGPVTYSAESLLEKNADAVNPDFVSLLRGGMGAGGAGAPTAAADSSGSSNPFVKGLFSSKAIATQVHPRDHDTIIAAQQPIKPMRTPSTRRKGGRGPRLAALGEEAEDGGEEARAVGGGNGGPSSPPPEIRCVVGEFKSALDVLFETFEETKAWFVFALNPNDVQLPNQLESRGLKTQVRSLGIPEMTQRAAAASFEVSMTHAEFEDRYSLELEDLGEVGGVEAIRALREAKGWPEKELAIGKFKVFVGYRAFRILEDRLRAEDTEEHQRTRDREIEHTGGLSPGGGVENDPFSPYRSSTYDLNSPSFNNSNPNFGNISSAALPLVANAQHQRRDYDDDSQYDDRKNDYAQSQFTSHYDDSQSNFGTEAYAPSRNMFGNMEKNGIQEKEALDARAAAETETTEVIKITSARKKWVALVWMLTWFVPSPFLRWFGGMKRPDVRQAWREKLAINIIIWFVCGCAIFVVAVLGILICPTQHVFSAGEISQQSYNNNPDKEYVSIRGEVFDLTSLARGHVAVIPVIKSKLVLAYGGLDATPLFPVQVSALCDGIDGSVSPWVQISSLNSTTSRDTNSVYHDFRAYTNDSRPDWYFEQMIYMRYNFRLGFVGILPKTIRTRGNAGEALAVYDNHVYSLDDYVKYPPYLRAPDGYQAEATDTTSFIAPSIVSLFQQSAGKDITKSLNNLKSSLGEDVFNRQMVCLRNLFLVGMVDNRQSVQCQFATYILLALSILMVTIIGFKFIGALHFGSARAPEDHDKFLICQVPCYTEGEDSLKKTIDSLARLKYDDKRKLLVVLCDGMIVGAGNDRPTPRIVLDILGVDPNLDPEPLSFLSLGEGQKQHNMGKVYAGLYECAGHVVPYVVIVKMGKPSERHRPGNRGKRDSQMILMHFFNKVHFNSEMSPLELEMYHQIKNVIGVNPSFYEYLFTVDADTTVEENSVNYLISAMVHDKKVIACCGETSIKNAKQSLTTMMQVYEYFISHHLAKSFESLFGSVTCLPGCFTLYRLRTPDTHKPLFIADNIILDYSENRVDTLHLKNLLHLGEDRYLTTLLLKHFPTYKTTFVRAALAQTVAPDEWRVLLSQRRRWINSTVHNLAELVFIDKLCGFCCFSMRFIVFIDLLSTVTAPVTVAYIVYLVYLVVAEGKTIPTLSLVMIGAIYGLQILIFLFRGKWDMIGWMVFYILAIPIFSFYLPLYSFWAMDDFSWGNTRVVVGESGKKLVVHDEGKFDPKSIPLKSWNEYENELWDKESNHSVGSWIPPSKVAMMADSQAQSLYGRQTIYDPPSRQMSPSPSGLDAYGNERGRYSSYQQPHDQEYAQSQYRANSFYGMDQTQGGGGGGDGYYRDERPPSTFHNSNLHHMGGSPLVPPSPSINLLPSLPSSAPLGVRDPPSDEELEASVRRILDRSDLNLVTKKGVRKELEQEYGLELSARKETINGFIEAALTGA